MDVRVQAPRSAETIDYFGDPLAYKGFSSEALGAFLRAGFINTPTYRSLNEAGQTRITDRALAIAGLGSIAFEVAVAGPAIVRGVRGLADKAVRLGGNGLQRLRAVASGTARLDVPDVVGGASSNAYGHTRDYLIVNRSAEASVQEAELVAAQYGPDFAKKYDIDSVKDYVVFRRVDENDFVSRFGNDKDAAYGGLAAREPLGDKELISFYPIKGSKIRSIAGPDGKVVVSVRASVLKSDPAIAATFSHEADEIISLERAIEEAGGTITLRKYYELVRPVSTNLHGNAVRVGNSAAIRALVDKNITGGKNIDGNDILSLPKFLGVPRR